MKLIGIAGAGVVDRASWRNSTVGALRFVKNLPRPAPNWVSEFESQESRTSRTRPTRGRGIGDQEGMCEIMGSKYRVAWSKIFPPNILTSNSKLKTAWTEWTTQNHVWIVLTILAVPQFHKRSNLTKKRGNFKKLMSRRHLGPGMMMCETVRGRKRSREKTEKLF